MEIYMCKNDGHFSLTNENSCPICDSKNWKPVDAQQLSPGDWQVMFGAAEAAEEEFQVVNAWAETGNSEAVRMRAMLLKDGTGCEKDVTRAIEDLSRLAEKKDKEAIFLLGCCYIAGDGVPADPMNGLSMLWQARDMKYPEAAWALATMYDSGIYVSQNKKKATKLFRQSAEMGSEMGMHEYGLRLFSSAKDEKQVELGLSWLWRAARSECGEAQVSLGLILGQDFSPVNDTDQALYWLERAVSNEVEGAAAAYASVWYNYNNRCFLDKEESDEVVQMLEDALKRGETSAAFMLGEFCREGEALPRDFDRAFKYYRMGQGHDNGCIAGVAHCYLYGLGVEKNPSLAHRILSDYIDLDGDYRKTPLTEMALLDLGDMYRDGNGVKQNPQTAAMIYSLAAQRTNSNRALGRLSREFLSGNPNILGFTEEQAIDILIAAGEEGNFDASFFLMNYYRNAGDMKMAAVYMNEALHYENELLDKPATKIAEADFPEILKNMRPDHDLTQHVMLKNGRIPAFDGDEPSPASTPA